MAKNSIPKKSEIDKVNDRIVKTNYKKAQKALSNSSFHGYVPSASEDEILKLSLTPTLEATKIKNVARFLKTISDIMQSMTTKGFTTFEIVSFIASEINKFGGDKGKIIDFLESSYTIIHSDYSNDLSKKHLNNVRRILFNHAKEEDFGAYTDIGYRLIGINPKVNRDIKTLCISKNANIVNKISQATVSPVIPKKIKSIFDSYYNNININKNIKNPTKNNPSYSSIMITNPDVKVGSRNAIELSTFFNSVSNVEFDRAYPYFNAEFIIPNYSKQDANAIIKAASINQFIHGTIDSSKTTQNYKNLEGGNVERENLNKGEKVIKTNMSLFTSPQTMTNLDEDIGHSSNKSRKSLRLTSVKDSTQPFMTLKSLSINVSPTKGLMSFKTGKLSLTLHDRSRLPDIAPFVKHDLFGAFGAEIVLEYGWSHLDEENPEENPLGAFIGNSRSKEVYMITNSSFSMDQTGMINIDLSISMKGASLLKNTEISFVSSNRIKEASLKSILTTITSCRMSLGLESEVSIHSRFSKTDILNPVKTITSSVAKEIIAFRMNSFFLTHKNITSNLSVKKLDDDNGKQRYLVEVNDDNTLRDKQDLFLKLIFGSKLNDINSDEERTISSDEDEETVRSLLNQILISFSELHKVAETLLQQDTQEEDNEAAILETIVGGIDFVDPYYPVDKGFYESISEHASFVSLGSIVSSLIQTHVVNKTPSDFDEVQTIFYSSNQFAAGMRFKNLATFLVPKEELKSFIKKEIKKEITDNRGKTTKGVTVVTIESIISQIINRFIINKNNVNYGLTDLYKNENNSVVTVHKDQDVHEKSLKRKLHKIYYPNFKGNITSSTNNCTFKVPTIKFSFDCVSSSNKHKENSKSILRISIYDENDSPYDTVSSVLESLYTDDFTKKVSSIAKINSKYQSLGSKALYKKKMDNEFEALIAEKYIITKGNNYEFNPLAKVSSINKQSGIKNFYKSLFPSMTFGTQHTAMLSANVSTVNDNKLATVYITRADRNNQSEINSRVKTNLPLRVMPTQASIETFGCPWINFGQFIFLDFDTGTTIDNKYAVTGITHNFSPGKFSTSLTLSYGDVYGQYESAADMIESIIPSLSVQKESSINLNNNESNENNSKDIIIYGAKYRENDFYKPSHSPSNAALVRSNRKQGVIEYVNPINSKFSNSPLMLMFFDNTYAKKAIKSEHYKETLYKDYKTSPNPIISAFNSIFKADMYHQLDLHAEALPKDNKLPFVFNTLNKARQEFKEDGSYKTKKLLVSQKSQTLKVSIKNPGIMFGEKSEKINLNKISPNFILQSQNVWIEKIKKEDQGSSPNTENFKGSNRLFIDLHEHINKVYKLQDDNFFTLKTRMLTLKDFLSEDFADNQYEKVVTRVVGFKFGRQVEHKSGTINKKFADAEDFLRVKKPKTTKSKIHGYGKDHIVTYELVEQSPVRKKIKEINENLKNGDILEINVGKAKKILDNDYRLSYIKSYNIFKTFDVSFETNIEVKINLTKAAINNNELLSQEGIMFYNATLNQDILKRVYDETAITTIKVLHGGTPQAKLLIIVTEYDIIDGFVDYNKKGTGNINLVNPLFTIATIFDKNFFGKDPKMPGYQFNSGKPENHDGVNDAMPSSKTTSYEVKLSSFYEYITEKIAKFISADGDNKKEFTLYKHNFDKKILGQRVANEKSKDIKSDIIKIKHSVNYEPAVNQFFSRLKSSISSLDSKDLHSLSVEPISWNEEISDPSKVKSVPAIVTASTEEYRGIKKKNLPPAQKKNLNLMVMEVWVPPANVNTGTMTSADGFNVSESFNYKKLEESFKTAHKDIISAKAEYDKLFPLDNSKTFVDIRSVKQGTPQAGKFLDVKISDLAIQHSTPDSAVLDKETKVQIEYAKSIVNNIKTVGETQQRRIKIQPALFYLLKYAASLTLKNKPGAFDKIYINSGGDIPLYLVTFRNNSLTIRHDSGYGADVMIYKGNKPLQLTENAENDANKDAVNQIIWFFLKTCKELGSTGIGADFNYDKGKAFHVDIASKNKDLSSGNYSNKEISIKYGGKQEVLSIAKLIKKVKITKNSRYWGKDNEGKHTAHGAPASLKDIFQNKKVKK